MHPEPKKSLGQNFLTDKTIARRIVSAANLNPSDCVIEIGPGTGALTHQLVQLCKQVIAIELDQRLIETLPTHPSLTIIHADALEINFAELVAQHTPKIQPPVVYVANLPYYITSAIIRHILENPLPAKAIVLMMQLEVAQRIVAQPGDLSLLAISVQFYGTPELLFRVPPSAFKPQPGVDSAVVRIIPHSHKPNIEPDQFFAVTKAGFCQPRKQLRNTLASGLSLTKAKAESWLKTAGVAPERRAETLTIEEWIRLTQLREVAD